MSEKSAYRALRRHVMRPHDRLDRIENIIGLGNPDTNGCFSGVEFWIEIKAPVEPKRITTPLFGSNHKVSQEQKNWFLRQRRAGGRAFVYIETDFRRILIESQDVDALNEMTIEHMMFTAPWWSNRPTTEIEWNELRATITNR